MKKIPMRSCVVTREKLPKNELLRVVRGTDGKVFFDKSGKANGRGAYLKADIDVIRQCQNSKILDKKLEAVVLDDVYKEICEYVENNK